MPPKSLLGKAITYTRRQWPQLARYIEHGETAIDNNTAERAIKPFVIGQELALCATKEGFNDDALIVVEVSMLCRG